MFTFFYVDSQIPKMQDPNAERTKTNEEEVRALESICSCRQSRRRSREERACHGGGALPVGPLVVGHGGLHAVVPLFEQRELCVDRTGLWERRARLEGRARL